MSAAQITFAEEWANPPVPPRAAVDWSPDQLRALGMIRDWRERWTGLYPQDDGRGYMTLGGYAGTGKTALIAQLAEEWPNTAVCALAGKAAYVLRQRGIAKASTIHSLIYFTEVVKKKPRFTRKSHLDNVQTIIVDEASMVDRRLFNDLLAFELPVLFVGDHGQLEPIGDNPNLMVNPDVRLETIHRQEKDNPIIRLAHAVREGKPTPRYQCPEGKLRMLSRKQFWEEIRHYRQVIVGFNKTRHKVNKLARNSMGISDLTTLSEGERLICLKNAPHWGLFNGQQVNVLEIMEEAEGVLALNVETDDGTPLVVDILARQLGKDLIDHADRNDGKRAQRAALMDYGYCITAHKAQGSSYSDVLVLEETAPAWDARRWKYTVATRAEQRLIWCS